MGLTPDDHRQILRRLSWASAGLYGLVRCLSSSLSLFDESPLLIHNKFLRWDLIHFAAIADQGYTYEEQWAFLPGAPLFMYISKYLVGFATNNVLACEIFTSVALSLLAFESIQTLYNLSLLHLKSPRLALLASALALLPSSPVTFFFVPYNEPFFTFLSYKGMHACATQQWTKAALFFAVASTFRSNGILLAGFLLWGLLVQPFMTGKRIYISTLIRSTILTAIIFVPFISYQAIAYMIFCLDKPISNPVSWRNKFPPSIYTHVQSKYWNVGFLRYWTVSQVPNFVIAVPPMALIFAYAGHHLRSVSKIFLAEGLRQTPSVKFQNALFITPHALHALLFSSILLFASHTQIVLRLAASMPFTYWAAAWLYIEYPRLGGVWVTWSLMWGLISTILWATFLPPA
ncbi:glycosyltransferase family 76 protein [Crepidotus variabilis]|uniref:GPI mannosyltransferase 2 n=1 Tax=Crepidotus variabilis TaxID=179855 RepID=A0A9P6JQX2_9AGAR|nr:glycosyltransferase family 76 protein [Crepidotus variabilis]